MACWENDRGAVGLEGRGKAVEGGQVRAVQRAGTRALLTLQSQDSGLCLQCDEKPAEASEPAEDPA